MNKENSIVRVFGEDGKVVVSGNELLDAKAEHANGRSTIYLMIEGGSRITMSLGGLITALQMALDNARSESESSAEVIRELEAAIKW